MANSSPPLQSTYTGYIGTTYDALILFESCLSGVLNHVPRRPHDRERTDIIKSGSVFIYEEHASGIKRWTDGVSWSPSRILGNFLIYRELDKPFQPGEKKRAMKRKKSGGIIKPEGSSRSNSVAFGSMSSTDGALAPSSFDNMPNGRETERALVGSLVDSYSFKERGLVKKTISVMFQGVAHHLVSYYTIEDVLEEKLQPPSRDPYLSQVIPRPELIHSGNFRAPIDDTAEYPFEERLRGYAPTGHFATAHHDMMPPGPPGSRSMSLPHFAGAQMGANQYSVPQPMSNAGFFHTPALPAVSYPPQQTPTYTFQQPAAPPRSSTGLPHLSPSDMGQDNQFRRHSSAYGNTAAGDASLPMPMNSLPENRALLGGSSSYGYSNGTPVFNPQREAAGLGQPSVTLESPHGLPAPSPAQARTDSTSGTGSLLDGIGRESSDWHGGFMGGQNQYYGGNSLVSPPLWSSGSANVGQA